MPRKRRYSSQSGPTGKVPAVAGALSASIVRLPADARSRGEPLPRGHTATIHLFTGVQIVRDAQTALPPGPSSGAGHTP